MTVTTKLRVGLIGYGYWGKNLLRNLLSHPNVTIVGVVDTDPVQRQKLAQQHPYVRTLEVHTDLLSFGIDAVAIATPPANHFDLAQCFLSEGIHTLVEKPVAQSPEHCQRLIDIAREKKCIGMVDHTFVYHPAVRALRNRIHSGELGSLQYYDSIRVNFGGFQKTNALWDLAPHDLSILDDLLNGQLPETISAIGVDHFNVEVENLVYVTLRYRNRFIAHLHLNRIAPVKLRQLMIGGSEKMAVYDDTLPTEKVKIYHRNVSLTASPSPTDTQTLRTDFSKEFETKNHEKIRVAYRTGDMVAPMIGNEEALYVMIDHFIDCIQNEVTPRSDFESGLRVLRILEKAQESLNQNGQVVSLTETEPSPGLPRSPDPAVDPSWNEIKEE